MFSGKGLRLVCVALALLVLGAFGVALLTSSGRSYYPDPKVTTPLGQPGICHHCGKAIPKVAPEQLVTIKAAQYVVCGQECSANIRKWHESQFGK